MPLRRGAVNASIVSFVRNDRSLTAGVAKNSVENVQLTSRPVAPESPIAQVLFRTRAPAISWLITATWTRCGPGAISRYSLLVQSLRHERGNEGWLPKDQGSFMNGKLASGLIMVQMIDDGSLPSSILKRTDESRPCGVNSAAYSFRLAPPSRCWVLSKIAWASALVLSKAAWISLMIDLTARIELVRHILEQVLQPLAVLQAFPDALRIDTGKELVQAAVFRVLDLHPQAVIEAYDDALGVRGGILDEFMERRLGGRFEGDASDNRAADRAGDLGQGIIGERMIAIVMDDVEEDQVATLSVIEDNPVLGIDDLEEVGPGWIVIESIIALVAKDRHAFLGLLGDEAASCGQMELAANLKEDAERAVYLLGRREALSPVDCRQDGIGMLVEVEELRERSCHDVAVESGDESAAHQRVLVPGRGELALR